MLGYVIFLVVLAIFAHNGGLLFLFCQDMSLYGRVSRLNKWILDLPAIGFWSVSLGVAFLLSLALGALGFFGILAGLAATFFILKDILAVIAVRKDV